MATKIDVENFMLTADNAKGKRQRRLLKKKRGGVTLTREQVKAIKVGRKHLRKELKARKIKGKSEFNLTASSLGLYFDRSRLLLFLDWLFKGRRLAMLLAALLAALLSLFLFSAVTQMRGHFTINMSEGMFREGFVLSETKDFVNPTTHLFAVPAENVPCISISHIPENIDDFEGEHNDSYFAYTYYIRNEGESTVGFEWEVRINSESLDISNATWVMIFEDGQMRFYAEPTGDGRAEALPPFGDNTRGYVEAPLIDQCAAPAAHYSEVAKRGNLTYYRVIPRMFETETRVASGIVENVAPQEVHKYTVVMWMEGDDPDCTDDLIGGHLGMEVMMRLVGEETESEYGEYGQSVDWKDLWRSLKFWEG